MTPEQNERLTRIGPGTAVGNMLRRYWWPVWFSDRIKGKPVPVRLLGEEFVLFRNPAGALGLVDRACPHRGAGLELGRVEADGIRCCYHGWKFAADGRCLDMPAEPPGTPLLKEVRIGAYPVAEAAGLVFAYIGPGPAPDLPRWDLLFEPGLDRTVGAVQDHCNWLQRVENTVDQLHATILHAAGYPELAFKRADIEWTRTPFGIRAEYSVGGGAGKVSHFVFPTANRYFGARVGEGTSQNMHIRVPVSDGETWTFYIRARSMQGAAPAVVCNGLRTHPRGVYERVEDGYWDLPNREQDRAAQESQGLIADRARETLGTSDRGVVMYRRMLEDAIGAAERGFDPPGVTRGAGDALISFDASQTREGQVLEA
ncbi:MAG: hypothetical protein RL477_173 [Pseudomonadota bacterium]|jgi:5,5'-dehydrodivanillate O-demethylase